METDRLTQFFSTLNEEQQRVAAAGPGKFAVLGVPGAGKTRAIIGRIARLVRDGLDPQYILAMTFTKNAATEMNARLTALGISGAKVATIHSLARQILVETGVLQGGIALHTDGVGKKCLPRALAKYRRNKGLSRGQRIRVKAIDNFLGFVKATGPAWIKGDPFCMNELAKPHVARIAQLFERDTKMKAMQLCDVFQIVEDLRTEESIYDFDDMQQWGWLVLAMGQWTHWRNKWSVIIIDEAQDSTPIQWDMARLLCGMKSLIVPEQCAGDNGPHNLMVAGQPEQSIYGFRAAYPEIFTEYADKPDTQRIDLQRNYRSLPDICTMGNELIAAPTWAITPPMVSMRTREHQPCITADAYASPFMEAEAVISRAQALHEAGVPYKDMAVLSRLGAAISLVEQVCLRYEVPYVKWASGSFLESKPVLDMLSYMKVVAGMEDEKDLRRIVNAPFRYIGKDALLRASQSRGWFLDAIAEDNRLNMKQRMSMRDLRDMVRDVKDKARRGAGASPLLRTILNKTEYIEEAHNDTNSLYSADLPVAEVISEVDRIARATETPEKMVATIQEMRQAAKATARRLKQTHMGNKDYLVLSTTHRSKGLEWPHVWLTDVVAGRLPHEGSDWDEELRIMYVACTRAKDRLYVSCTEPGEEEQHSPFFSHVLEVLEVLAGAHSQADR